jgi:hypothetical protein
MSHWLNSNDLSIYLVDHNVPLPQTRLDWMRVFEDLVDLLEGATCGIIISFGNLEYDGVRSDVPLVSGKRK